MSLFFQFKNNLQKTSNFLTSNILNSFKNKKVDENTLEELEWIPKVSFEQLVNKMVKNDYILLQNK